MYRVPNNNIRKHGDQKVGDQVIDVPKLVLVDCPLCYIPNITFPTTWQPFKLSNDTATMLKFPFFALSTCGNCREVVTFLLIKPEQNSIEQEGEENSEEPELELYLQPAPQSHNNFDEHIIGLSPGFIEIYNQAIVAEKIGLNHLSGVGYRKALEFLIKDFLIKKLFVDEEAKKEDVKTMTLYKAVKELPSQRMKMVAKRAVWLGNDETHYHQIWERAIERLKELINIIVADLSAELLAQRMENSGSPEV